MLYQYLWLCLVIFLEVVIAKQPNILLIVADDFGWNDVGYHGSEIQTPNLDQLATFGIRLENYYVQPICSPSRSQLMTGRYQIHTGLQHGVIQPDRPYGLPLELPTMADLLKKQGYSTHIIGKWHLGFYKKEYAPIYRGFDSFYGYLIGAEDYYTHRRDYVIPGRGTVEGLDLRHNMDIVTDQNGTYSTHLFAERAQKLVQQHAEYNSEQPLFLYLPFQSVHAPLEVPEHYEEKYSFIKNKDRRTYAGMVSAMDEAVGNIVDSYKAAGLWDNTILIFSTDNGGQVMAGGNNWPLRGWKGQLWEGGVHGVGFVHSPLLPHSGEQYIGLVHVSDWFPTVVGLAGGKTTGMKLDSHDVWQAISGGSVSPRKERLHNIDPLYDPKGEPLANCSFDIRVRSAIRVGDWKLLTGDPGIGRWIPPPHLDNSLTYEPIDGSTDRKNLWLFNIPEDPRELVDVSAAYPDIVHRLLDRLAAYNSTAVPVLHPPQDPEADPALHGDVWGPWR